MTYELVLPDGWTTADNPYRLYRPDGTQIASEGDVIQVTGEATLESGGFCFGSQILANEIEMLSTGSGVSA